ncbi:MAG: AraC family transcriptional regulator [Cupriavidus necator]
MKPLIRAGCLAGYTELAQSLGLNAARELRRAGLSAKSLADPEALIPYTSVMELLEASAAESGKPDFGLRLSSLQDIEILGPLAVLIRHAPTLGEALQMAARYAFVHSPAIRVGAEPVAGKPAQVDLWFEIVLPQRPACAQTIELSVALSLRIIRLLSRQRLHAPLALFPHSRVGALADYAAALGCECRFSMPRAAVRISAADLERPLPEHNPLLQQMARSYLEQHFARPDIPVADQVRTLVRRFMGIGPVTQVAISEALAVPSRTLQRALAKEQTSFESILDDARQDRLRELLAQSQPPSLTQISLILGYSQQATLTRSCHRWFGYTPTELVRNPSLLSRQA